VPRRSGVSCVAARSAPAMRWASGAFPRDAAGMASRPARAARWDSNAVLTHHAKILPRKQGFASPGIGFCDPFVAVQARLGIRSWRRVSRRSLEPPLRPTPGSRQHVRGPRTALSRNPVAAHLVPCPGNSLWLSLTARRRGPPRRLSRSAAEPRRQSTQRGVGCSNALIQGLPIRATTEPP
jgi:hypothetical protein